jgi:hypothetical protein
VPLALPVSPHLASAPQERRPALRLGQQCRALQQEAQQEPQVSQPRALLV